MEPILFFGLAALLLGSAAAMVWLKHPLHAATALVGTLLAGTGLVAWLRAEFLAVALLLALAGGAALLLLVAMPILKRLGPLGESRPDEDRSFWAGIVTVLFVVITYRVLATASWGLEDRSRMALSDAQRGLEAVRLLGAALSGEYALALLMAAGLVGVTVAAAFALSQRGSEA